MAYESIFPHVVNNLKYHLEVVTPAAYGASIIEELAAVPLTGTQSDKLIRRMYDYVAYIYKIFLRSLSSSKMNFFLFILSTK